MLYFLATAGETWEQHDTLWKRIKKCDDVIHAEGNSNFTVLTSDKTAEEISKKLKLADLELIHFIIEIKDDNTGGWMDKDLWDFIKAHTPEAPKYELRFDLPEDNVKPQRGATKPPRPTGP